MTDWIEEVPQHHEGRTRGDARLLSRCREQIDSPAGAIGLFLFLSPCLALFSQVMFQVVVVLLQTTVALQLFRRVLLRVGFDPIYSGVFERTMGSIEVQGLAVAGAVGDLLHLVAPWLFATPERVRPGAWASVLVSDESSLLASTTATIGAEVAFILMGLVLARMAYRAARARGEPSYLLGCLGLLFQIRGILGLFSVRLSFDDLEAMGLTQFFTKLVPLDPETYRKLVVEPLNPFGPFALPATVLVTVYGAAVLGSVLVRRARRSKAARRWRARFFVLTVPLPGRGNARVWIYTPLVLLSLVATVLLSQHVFPAQAHYDHPATGTGPGRADWNLPPAEGILARPTPTGPSTTAIAGDNYTYLYTVDGRRQRMRGVGYNVAYAQLPPEDRAARYDRDFSQMRAAGMNTILGWDHREFDELTLTKAQEHGLGVVLPYHLPPDGHYGNPSYLEAVEEDVLRWVRRFRGYPALRMWGIGNEVLHDMGRSPNTALGRAFVQFYVRLADRVHALDPAHPVVYRDAEDAYLKQIRNALQNDRQARPWFAYGVNFFTYRICEALRDWPKMGLDAPLLVSEFAPNGFSRQERPRGYQRMWQCIAEYPDSVLGGFAYVWSTDGPEVIDRVLGLVDAQNVPVDGSLAGLGEVYRQDQSRER